MPLNGTIWIIMQHSRSWSMFTLDALLTVINLIYKNLIKPFQPFDGLSIIINDIKFLLKKEYKCVYNIYSIIYMVFTTEWFLEIAIERWPEWDLNPRPLNLVQSYQAMSSTCTQSQLCTATPIYVN